MTLLQLSYFVSLAETLHYTKTAEQLHISQPSLSYAIRELEKDLHVPLFEKNNRGIALTSYGGLFYPYAKKALQSLEDGRSRLKAMSDQTDSVVRLGYFHSISASLVPALIKEFRQLMGDSRIRFQLTEDTIPGLMAHLRAGDLDFCFTCHEEEDLSSVIIGRQPLYLAVSNTHPLSGREYVSMSEIMEEPQIMLTEGSDLRQQLDQLFADSGITPRIAFETRECNAALQYVSLDFGVAILPEVPMMHQDNIVRIPLVDGAWREVSRSIYFSCLEGGFLSASARVFLDYIRERFC